MREAFQHKQIDYYELEVISDYLQISLHPSLLKELSMRPCHGSYSKLVNSMMRTILSLRSSPMLRLSLCLIGIKCTSRMKFDLTEYNTICIGAKVLSLIYVCYSLL